MVHNLFTPTTFQIYICLHTIRHIHKMQYIYDMIGEKTSKRLILETYFQRKIDLGGLCLR